MRARVSARVGARVRACVRVGARVFNCKCVGPNEERDPRPYVYPVCAQVCDLCVLWVMGERTLKL